MYLIYTKHSRTKCFATAVGTASFPQIGDPAWLIMYATSRQLIYKCFADLFPTSDYILLGLCIVIVAVVTLAITLTVKGGEVCDIYD